MIKISFGNSVSGIIDIGEVCFVIEWGGIGGCFTAVIVVCNHVCARVRVV